MVVSPGNKVIRKLDGPYLCLPAVGRIEQGERRLDVVELVRLCRAIRCDPYEALDLVTGGDWNAREEVKIAAESRRMYRTK